MSEGWVFDITRGSFHDGPGIRTTVFLQGCPLSCIWCHNPESWDPRGKAKLMTVGTVMDVVRRDRPFYEASGGGITLSGGEPTWQFGFCSDLLAAAKGEGIHTCLDTSGAFAASRVADLAPLVDLWLFDYKATNPPREWLGFDDERLRETLKAVLFSGARVWLRCPLVPGLNDSPEHLAAIAALSHRVERVELMPYHKLGEHKRPASLADLPELREATEGDRARWLALLVGLGAVRVGFG